MFDPAAQGLAGLQVTQILRGDVDDVVEGGGQVEPAGDVRRDEHVGRIPQRACCGQWLRVGDIDRGTGKVSGLESGNQIVGNHKIAAAAVGKEGPGFIAAKNSAFARPRVSGVLGIKDATMSASARRSGRASMPSMSSNTMG